MSIKEKMAEAANLARRESVLEAYELLKGNGEWQNKNKTQHLYMLCIACDVTAPVMQNIVKELGIEL